MRKNKQTNKQTNKNKTEKHQKQKTKIFRRSFSIAIHKIMKSKKKWTKFKNLKKALIEIYLFYEAITEVYDQKSQNIKTFW